jgi:hypothetical protein
MHDYTDQYQMQAEECRRLADLSPNVGDKSFWLRLAEDWLRLVEVMDGFRCAEAVPDEIRAEDL